MATPFLLGSYLTCEEYRARPTALNTENLVPGGTQAQQDAMLAGLIGEASRQIDVWARQPLYATVGQQNDQDVRVESGDALCRAKQDRVKSVTSFAWGSRWEALTTVTSPACWIEENLVRVSLSGVGTVWSGSLNLTAPSFGRCFVSWSYVAGWVTTRLSAAANTGDTTITVENANGITGANTGGLPPTYLRLTNGAVQNTYLVQSIAGSVVTLASPLAEAWPAGSGAGEVDDAIKDATVLVVSHYIKRRKGSGVVMSKNPTTSTQELGDEMADAQRIAERFQRKAP